MHASNEYSNEKLDWVGVGISVLFTITSINIWHLCSRLAGITFQETELQTNWNLQSKVAKITLKKKNIAKI